MNPPFRVHQSQTPGNPAFHTRCCCQIKPAKGLTLKYACISFGLRPLTSQRHKSNQARGKQQNRRGGHLYLKQAEFRFTPRHPENVGIENTRVSLEFEHSEPNDIQLFSILPPQKKGHIMYPFGLYYQWFILLGDLKRLDDTVAIALHADRVPFFQHL